MVIEVLRAKLFFFKEYKPTHLLRTFPDVLEIILHGHFHETNRGSTGI